MVLLLANRFLTAKLGVSDIQIPSPSTPIPRYALQTSTSIHLKSKTRFNFCCCSSNGSSNENQPKTLEGFSVLESDPPWESGSVWTTMALYFFSLHIPLSFGGLSVVAQMLDQPQLEPQVKAVALLFIETLELFGALLVLQMTAKPHNKPVDFFKPKESRSERNWVFSALLGFVVLVVAISVTSSLADRIIQNEDGNNQLVKEILSSGLVSQTACTLVYCIIAPLLEEIVYRGFLLTSLAPCMKWHQAVFISSLVFSASHLSGENFIQLFIVGVVLGCSYCWTGDLRSSILLHSVYNALTLLITVFT